MGKRIMTVDDSATMRKMLESSLTEAGYEVIEASDGQEALDRLSAAPVDMVITDLTMPRVTGTELARAVADLRPGLPVVLCTGHAEARYDRVAGIRQVLKKPFPLRQLGWAVWEVLHV